MWGKKVCRILQVFLQKKSIAKTKCKDKDAESTSELWKEEHKENANIVETNIEIKVEEEFPAGINVVKEIEGNNDDVPKEKSSEWFYWIHFFRYACHCEPARPVVILNTISNFFNIFSTFVNIFD